MRVDFLDFGAPGIVVERSEERLVERVGQRVAEVRLDEFAVEIERDLEVVERRLEGAIVRSQASQNARMDVY